MLRADFPYQLVAFLGQEPSLGEPVYSGKNGWYPQIALKRRFNVTGIEEDELISKINLYCQNFNNFTVKIGGISKPGNMPVRVLEVDKTPELINFHQGFIKYLDTSLVSRYPERDGINYMPHITAEWEGQVVIDTDRFSNTEVRIKNIFLLKDLTSDNSVAFKKFALNNSLKCAQ